MHVLVTVLALALVMPEVLAVLNGGASGFPSSSADDSPYCEELNNVVNICDHIMGQFVCSKTCSTPKRRGEKTCGIQQMRNDLPTLLKRIVGGVNSNYGDWPWQVALMLHGKQACAGAVIASEWIVTTAHCFGAYSSLDPNDWSILAGEHHLFEKETFEQGSSVAKIIRHEKNFHYWKLGYDIPDDYDLALLKLTKKLVFTPYVQPACLPDDHVHFSPGASCKVAGWGHTQWNGSQPDILKDATVELIPREICNMPRSYNGTIHGRAICAGFQDGGVDACQYDSGGGLVCSHDDQWFLQGLVSWGYECARPHKYGVYTNLPLLKQWIIDNILGYNA